MTSDPLDTTDAMVWADEFVRTLREHPETADPYDPSFMVGWFANAMAAQEAQDRQKQLPRWRTDA